MGSRLRPRGGSAAHGKTGRAPAPVDPPKYRTAQAAAARFARLHGDLPGSVKGIDYEAMATALLVSARDSEAPQDRALDILDEYRDLERVFAAAAGRAGKRDFWVWGLVCIVGRRPVDVQRELGISSSTYYRIVRRVSGHVDAALIERDVLRGYHGRDLIETTERRPRVEVFRNPNAWSEHA